ncbi:MAG: CpsD/CapB family tyrosine-protein kinase, partial [Verrucomicrobiota bacterium]
AQIANDTTSSDLKTFQLAPFEGSDAGFSLIILLLGGFILGTGSGLFLAIVRGYVLEKGIRNRIEWSQNFQIPLLGELLYHNDDQLTPWELIEGGSADMNQYYQTESIRSVRAQITLLGRASDKKRLLIASALPEEGKTTLATSLALSFARLKAPTLLIDLDLRKPSVHEALRLPNEMGMSDLLTEKASAKDVIQELEDGALHVITGGALIPHAPELLSTTTLEEILDELSPSYERIIIDSAPLLPVADTKLIAPFADCSLLAVRANRTELPSIETTLVELGAAGSQVAGAVLNFVRVSDAKSTQERSGYGYAYGQPSVSKS